MTKFCDLGAIIIFSFGAPFGAPFETPLRAPLGRHLGRHYEHLRGAIFGAPSRAPLGSAFGAPFVRYYERFKSPSRVYHSDFLHFSLSEPKGHAGAGCASGTQITQLVWRRPQVSIDNTSRLAGVL